MTNRLLVGSGPLLSTVVTALQTRPGSVQVATTDSALAESLHGTVTVRDVDGINRGVLLSFDRPDVVGVFGESRRANRSLATTVRDVFPDAKLIVYGGERVSEEDLSGPSLESVADVVVDRLVGPLGLVRDVEVSYLDIVELPTVLPECDVALFVNAMDDLRDVVADLFEPRIAFEQGASLRRIEFGDGLYVHTPLRSAWSVIPFAISIPRKSQTGWGSIAIERDGRRYGESRRKPRLHSDYCNDLPVRPHHFVRSIRNRLTVITIIRTAVPMYRSDYPITGGRYGTDGQQSV